MEHIAVTVEDGVGRLTIDRPDHFNSFDVETAQDFRKAGLQLARDDDVRCGVLQGTGDVFCSGADLRYIYEGGDEEELSYLLSDATGDAEGYGRSFKQMLEYVHGAISEIRKAPKPFVAAVDGIAAAGGFGIAMACDLVYASDEAAFEWAYHKTGLTDAESSTFFLPRLVGFRTAMELMLRSPRLSAAEAVEMGLVNDMFPAEEFDARVDDIVAELANGPTEAYGVANRTRKSTNTSRTPSLQPPKQPAASSTWTPAASKSKALHGNAGSTPTPLTSRRPESTEGRGTRGVHEG